MQTSHTAHNFHDDDDDDDDQPTKPYPVIKYIRSHDSHDSRQRSNEKSPMNNIRSMSSTFRQSIRHLTSCASARRKTGRQSNHNKQVPPTAETSLVCDDDQTNSSNKFYPSTANKSSSTTLKFGMRSIGSSNHLISQDLPPALPPRKPLDKKNSTQTSINTYDETMLAPSRILPNKEISTSLVNLMGTATDSVSNNHSTPNANPESRLRKHSVFSFFQRISTTPAANVDRLGLLDPISSNSNARLVDSPSSYRSVYSGQQTTITSSTSYMKSNNDFHWIHESSAPLNINGGTSIDDCLPRLEIDDKPLIYRQQFEPNEHFNWYGLSESAGPVIISYKFSIDQNKQRSIMAIVRTRQGTSIETFLDIHWPIIPADILRRICEQCAITDIEYFDPVLCDGTHELLLKYDESHVSNQHKFGIIFQRENQITEEDIFSNETGSIAMDNFLNLIGTRVKLKDFRGFRGGLDVRSDQTGTESIYEQFQNHEIMFHVSTLLPHSKSERQQLERKRHIGNDIVAIVFQETETIFNPECITSQFLHVYLVVTPLDDQGTQYKIDVFQRDSVPSFGPPIFHSKTFQCDHSFKNWILTKLINAEMASCRASTFQKYQERTKMTLFENLYRTLHENNRPLMSFIVHHSQYRHEFDLEQQQREESQINSSKSSERHTDNSLLGSVRRRFIAPKLRVQNSHSDNSKSSSSATTNIVVSSSNNAADPRSKTRSMTMDLRRSVSRESINTNGHSGPPNGNSSTGRMTSFFSSSKTSSPRLDKSRTSRSLLDQETTDSQSNSRLGTKYLSPATCPSSPWTSGSSNGFLTASSSNDLNNNNNNGDSYLSSTFNTSFHFNTKLSLDETDPDLSLQFSPDDLQASSKDDLIKVLIALQQQHQNKIAQMDQTHHTAMKRLEMQILQKQQTIDRDSP